MSRSHRAMRGVSCPTWVQAVSSRASRRRPAPPDGAPAQRPPARNATHGSLKPVNDFKDSEIIGSLSLESLKSNPWKFSKDSNGDARATAADAAADRFRQCAPQLSPTAPNWRDACSPLGDKRRLGCGPSAPGRYLPRENWPVRRRRVLAIVRMNVVGGRMSAKHRPTTFSRS